MASGPEAVLPVEFAQTWAGVGVMVATVELQSTSLKQNVASLSVGVTVLSEDLRDNVATSMI